MKFFLSLLLFFLSLHAISFEMKTDSLDELYTTISTQQSVQEIKTTQKVPFESLKSSSFVLDESKDAELKKLQKNLVALKRLQANLANDTTQENVRERLQASFFALNANLKHELSFAWAIEYPTSKSYEEAYAAMQQKISMYVLQTYGIANVAYKQVMKNLDMESENINSQTIGTIEVTSSNKTNSFHYSQNTTTRSGILTLTFYPFALVKRADSQTSSLSNQTQESAYTLSFVDLQKGKELDAIETLLQDNDGALFSNFFASFRAQEAVNIDEELHAISSKINLFSKNLAALFESFAHCETLGCIEEEITKKIAKLSDFGGEREYVYDIYLSNDIQYKYALQTALMELRDKLAQDTVVRAIDDNENLSNTNYSRSTNESKFKPVYKYVEILPFFESNRLGIRAIVRLSFEASDLCSQYLLGVTRDETLGMTFSLLKAEDGSEIEVAQTNLTNAQYNRFMSSKRQRECEATKDANQPVNCIGYDEIDSYLAKLNDKNDGYSYRLLRCDEWSFFATCGGKQKYCWGNEKNYKPHEFIITDIYSFRLKNVAMKKQNALGLFDMCGNGYEYCVRKNGAYRCGTTDKKSLEPKVQTPSWPDVNTIRIAREKI